MIQDIKYTLGLWVVGWVRKEWRRKDEKKSSREASLEKKKKKERE